MSTQKRKAKLWMACVVLGLVLILCLGCERYVVHGQIEPTIRVVLFEESDDAFIVYTEPKYEGESGVRVKVPSYVDFSDRPNDAWMYVQQFRAAIPGARSRPVTVQLNGSVEWVKPMKVIEGFIGGQLRSFDLELDSSLAVGHPSRVHVEVCGGADRPEPETGIPVLHLLADSEGCFWWALNEDTPTPFDPMTNDSLHRLILSTKRENKELFTNVLVHPYALSSCMVYILQQVNIVESALRPDTLLCPRFAVTQWNIRHDTRVQEAREIADAVTPTLPLPLQLPDTLIWPVPWEVLSSPHMDDLVIRPPRLPRPYQLRLGGAEPLPEFKPEFDAPPRARNSLMPKISDQLRYPDDTIRLQLRVYVSWFGKPRKVVIEEGADAPMAYRRAAISAAMRSRWTPATHNGIPVGGSAQYEVMFLPDHQ